MSGRQEAETEQPDDWLARFHAGDRGVLEACYRAHFADVETAVGRVLQGADRETAIHEVFLALLERQQLREGFRGGSLRAWLTTVARNHAVDVWRRRRRERDYAADKGNQDLAPEHESDGGGTIERSAEARLLASRLLRENLAPELLAVFEVRFVGGLDQRAAAAKLGLSRTTLAYREMKVRRVLLKQLARGEVP